MSPTFRSLSNPNYRLYAAGNLVSNVGTWMQRVAQDWLILLLTANSAAAIGITTGLQFLPILVLSPFAGVIADRIPKRRLLQMTNVGMAAPALLLGALAVTGTVQVWHVYVLALVLGVSTAFDAPARQSFVSEMVDPADLSNAVGLNSAGFNLARIVGPAIAGLSIALLGGGVTATGWVILVNGLTYAGPVLALALLDGGRLHSAALVVRGPGQILAGVSYVRRRPDLLLILAVVFFAGTFGLNFQMTSALMATEVFDKGPTEYGLLGTFMAVGSLAGSLMAAGRARIRHRLVIGSAIAFGTIEVVAGLAALLPHLRPAVPVAGAGRADDDHRRQHLHADEHRRRHARSGDGALPDGLHGRYAARLAADRLGRGGLRGAVDPDRRGTDDRRRRRRRLDRLPARRPAPRGRLGGSSRPGGGPCARRLA